MYRQLLWTISLVATAQPALPTLTLRDALAATEKLSPAVQIARLRVLESQAAIADRASAYQPQLSAVVGQAYATNNIQGIGLVLPGLSSRLGPYRLFNARPVLTQTVLDLSLLSSIRAARERNAQAGFEATVARESALAAVVQIYLQVLETDSRIRAAEARLQTAEAIVKQTSDLEHGGSASKLDLARAEQEYQSERTAAINARRNRAVMMTWLVRTIGKDDAHDYSLETPVVRPVSAATPIESSMRAASSERAELKALDAKARGAQQERAEASRQRWPKIGVAGDYGVLGAGPDRSLSTYSVGVSLNVPLWTGGRIAAQVAGAESRLAQVEHEKRNARLQIAQEVRQAAIELRAAEEALDASRKATAAARETVELARLRFGSGLSSNIDVIQAQGLLAQAEDVEIRARYESMVAVGKLAYARGDVRSFLQD